MISSLQSREFGFRLELLQENINKVNEYNFGEKYKDERAAIEKWGSRFKNHALEESPFVFEFNYGSQEEGYWCYEFMVLQLEDCIGYLIKLRPEFDYPFLFDHLGGHDRQQEDGLNTGKC
jgi:hypothetical protein